MKISVLLLCFSLFGTGFTPAEAQLKTARIFGDHMVLQRDQQISVWGWAAPGARVRLELNAQSRSVKATKTGYWKASLMAMPAGGPYELKINSGRQSLNFRDVMLGEVWICSGQSNMEFALKSAYGYAAEKKVAASLQIRQFQVPKTIELSPQPDLSKGEWTKPDPATVGEFTAVGYYFAKKLSEKLHVTLGLINSNWGGTQVEDWISRDAMLASPDFHDMAAALPGTWQGVQSRLDRHLKQYVYQGKAFEKYEPRDLANRPQGFFDAWPKGAAPAPWEWQGQFYSYRGQGFMQRSVEVDSLTSTKVSVLHLGKTDADMEIYLNGKSLLNGQKPADFQVNLPAGSWKAGANSLLIDLKSMQKNPEWFGIGLTGSDLAIVFSDTTVSLADANWHLMPDFAQPYTFKLQPNNTAFLLYNTMIAPLVDYAMQGVIWYQGESNASRAFEYRKTFPMMIQDWRSRWHRDFPFLFVQLSSNGGNQSSNYGSKWAELREAQTRTLSLPQTGMAVTTDIGDPADIHPKNKKDVGLRLAAKALAMTYHLAGESESPLFTHAGFADSSATLSFSHADSGLVVKDKYGYLRGFEIAGADRQFYYARASIVNGNQVKVWSPQVAKPVSVHYAWTEAPVEANLFNKQNFPVSPFRTDDWPGLTDAIKFE